MKCAARFFNRIFLSTVLFSFFFDKLLCVPQFQTRFWRFRRCQSLETTFFRRQCLPIGSTEHCPNDMQLYNGRNNHGFCDCMDIDSLFYSYETGKCYFHNTQGPCLSGEWFVLKNGFGQCELVPEGCPADGQHFYGSPDEAMEKQCWEIGTQGPCSFHETLRIEADAEELKILCSFPGLQVFIPFSVGSQASCRPGTMRSRLGECRRGIIG